MKPFITARQIEVLQLIAEGYSNQEAADRLFVAKVTVDESLLRAYRALGVKNRTGAIRKAQELGLLTLPEVKTDGT